MKRRERVVTQRLGPVGLQARRLCCHHDASSFVPSLIELWSSARTNGQKAEAHYFRPADGFVGGSETGPKGEI